LQLALAFCSALIKRFSGATTSKVSSSQFRKSR
jgi:hypothetical protein